MCQNFSQTYLKIKIKNYSVKGCKVFSSLSLKDNFLFSCRFSLRRTREVSILLQKYYRFRDACPFIPPSKKNTRLKGVFGRRFCFYGMVRRIVPGVTSHRCPKIPPPVLGTKTMASDSSHSPLWQWYDQSECIIPNCSIWAMIPLLGLVKF